MLLGHRHNLLLGLKQGPGSSEAARILAAVTVAWWAAGDAEGEGRVSREGAGAGAGAGARGKGQEEGDR